ncbi:hypothetical protein C0J52_25303, partial [Blattella germanica]
TIKYVSCENVLSIVNTIKSICEVTIIFICEVKWNGLSNESFSVFFNIPDFDIVKQQFCYISHEVCGTKVLALVKFLNVHNPPKIPKGRDLKLLSDKSRMLMSTRVVRFRSPWLLKKTLALMCSRMSPSMESVCVVGSPCGRDRIRESLQKILYLLHLQLSGHDSAKAKFRQRKNAT